MFALRLNIHLLKRALCAVSRIVEYNPSRILDVRPLNKGPFRFIVTVGNHVINVNCRVLHSEWATHTNFAGKWLGRVVSNLSRGTRINVVGVKKVD